MLIHLYIFFIQFLFGILGDAFFQIQQKVKDENNDYKILQYPKIYELIMKKTPDIKVINKYLQIPSSGSLALIDNVEYYSRLSINCYNIALEYEKIDCIKYIIQ